MTETDSPSAAQWAATVEGPVTVNDVEARVLGLDEQSRRSHRAEDERHAHPLRRLGRILTVIVAGVATTGPLWSFVGILDRSEALTKSYDVPPSVEYPTIFVAHLATSLMLAQAAISMGRRREGYSYAITFWFFFTYCCLLPLATFWQVERGPETPPTWMLYPALTCAALGMATAVLSVVFPRAKALEEDHQHRRLLHYTRQDLRRGRALSDLEPGTDGKDYAAASREALLRDRREALEVLVARGLLDATTAARAAALPLGEAFIEPEPSQTEREAAAQMQRFALLRDRREALDVLVARGEMTQAESDQMMARLRAEHVGSTSAEPDDAEPAST